MKGAKFRCEFISSCINWCPLDEDRSFVRGGFCCSNECRDVCLFGAFHKSMLTKCPPGDGPSMRAEM